MQAKSNFSSSKKLSFIPPGQMKLVRLSVETSSSDTIAVIRHALTNAFDHFTLLPNCWNHFEVLRKHNIRSTNLTGRGLTNGREAVFQIDGTLPNDDPNETDVETIPIQAQIYTTFVRTARIGENEYSWHSYVSEKFASDERFPTMISLLTHPEVQLSLCRFGLTRYRRINFGPIANPFPVAAGELNVELTPSGLTLTANYLRIRDLPELSSIAQNLAKLKVNNELLDHVDESH